MVLVIYMLGQADDDSAVWDRRIYIFGSAEAIVFTAVGWLFGREVHRAAAETAREDAKAAKADAEEKGQQVAELTERSAKGDALKAAVEAAAAARQPRRATRATDVGEEEDDDPPPPAAAADPLASLQTFAAKLYDE